MDPSKRAVVHMAATIKVMCPHVKTLVEAMRIVKFKDEDMKHASSFWRATDRRVTQLIMNNKYVPVPIQAINTPVTADAMSTIPLPGDPVIKLSTSEKSFPCPQEMTNR